MRIFVTGSTGFIGSAVVRELLIAGHQVLGLTRSDAGVEALIAAGAEPHRGSLEDLESLRSGAASADGVIHLAFNHDFSKFVANCEADRRIIEILASPLADSDRPLIVTSGTGVATVVPGKPAIEETPPVSSSIIPRAASEEAANLAGTRGVNVSIVRLPQVHDEHKQGLISYAIPLAREKGVSPYIGDGLNRWAAAHISDVARLYRLAIERRVPGSVYHAVGEEGVTMREVAEVIARGLKIPAVSLAPDQSAAHFGWLAMFAGHDMPASSKKTQELLEWTPTGPGLIADLERMDYSEV
jgi:nucleoside-diphosphate-sugar epimerase